MSTNFFFKSIALNNYRAFKDLTIESFKRINIIGGQNGTGKSTLLEALFLILDYKTPHAVTRPYGWRRSQFGASLIDQLFYEQNQSLRVSITAETIIGTLKTAIEHTSPPIGVPIQISANPLQAQLNTKPQPINHQQSNQDKGLKISVERDHQQIYGVFILGIQNGISATQYLLDPTAPSTSGIIINAVTQNSLQEDSDRFSAVLKTNKEEQLLKMVLLVRNDITKIQILSENGAPIFYASLSNKQFLPLAMLGGGVQTILSIGLAIINCKNGALFLDEFESAIHYSNLTNIWEKIGEMAEEYNCQIFAVTHSLECVKFATESLRRTERTKDLQYIRLENRKGTIKAEIYDANELTSALSGQWEIR